jgi:serralysin
VGDHYELQEVVIGEAGQTSVKHWSKTVLLEHAYDNPVVFAQPASYAGGQTAVVRITDVQSDRFTLHVDEAPNHDGYHPWETVSYVVLEAGSWELADGTRLEVGKRETMATVGRRVSSPEWASVTLAPSFPTTPTVLSQVQTENDPHWVKTRQRNVAPGGFQVALEEEEDKTTWHGSAEVIGWLAMEPGQGNWSGHTYEAGQTDDAVTHNWHTITFAPSFEQAPRFVASLASYDGADNAHLRYQNLVSVTVQVKVEEDTTYDSERNHANEVVHYLAVEAVTNGRLDFGTWERIFSGQAGWLALES